MFVIIKYHDISSLILNICRALLVIDDTDSIMRFSVYEANFCRTNWLIQKSLTKYTGNLIMPAGKTKRGQSLKNKTLELATASPTNFIFQISPSLCFLSVSSITRSALDTLSNFCANNPLNLFKGCFFNIVKSFKILQKFSNCRFSHSLFS